MKKCYLINYFYWCVFDDECVRHTSIEVEANNKQEAIKVVKQYEDSVCNKIKIDSIVEVEKW